MRHRCQPRACVNPVFLRSSSPTTCSAFRDYDDGDDNGFENVGHDDDKTNVGCALLHTRSARRRAFTAARLPAFTSPQCQRRTETRCRRPMRRPRKPHVRNRPLRSHLLALGTSTVVVQERDGPQIHSPKIICVGGALSIYFHLQLARLTYLFQRLSFSAIVLWQDIPRREEMEISQRDGVWRVWRRNVRILIPPCYLFSIADDVNSALRQTRSQARPWLSNS